jgi:hypothetical protein
VDRFNCRRVGIKPDAELLQPTQHLIFKQINRDISEGKTEHLTLHPAFFAAAAGDQGWDY